MDTQSLAALIEQQPAIETNSYQYDPSQETESSDQFEASLSKPQQKRAEKEQSLYKKHLASRNFEKSKVNVQKALHFKAIDGRSFVVRDFPCTIGSASHLTMKLAQGNAAVQHSSLHDDGLQHRLIVSSCKNISRSHIIVTKDTHGHKCQVLAPVIVNGVNYESGSVPLIQFALFQFPCDDCHMPHVYHISYEPLRDLPILPAQSKSLLPLKGVFSRHIAAQMSVTGYESQYLPAANETGLIDSSLYDKPDDVDGKWSSNLKESLKKYLLLFGFQRIDKIRKVSENLACVPIEQFNFYLNSFIKMMHDNLPAEFDIELKPFLSRKINFDMPSITEKTQDTTKNKEETINEELKFWGGDKILHQIVPWVRRMVLLEVLYQLVTEYKLAKHEYLERSEQDQRLAQLYRSRDNLICFMTEEQQLGMRPASWWQRSHDVDLIFGVYKHGFGNYQAIREDKKFGFWDIPVNVPGEPLEEKHFPHPEHITKRLKKMLLIAAKIDRFDFEKVGLPERTGIKLDEKFLITNYLTDIGLDTTKDKPYALLKTKISEKAQASVEAGERQIERFVHMLINESNRMVREYQRKSKEDDDQGDFAVPKEKKLLPVLEKCPELKQVIFDPDLDNFGFSIVEAFKVHARVKFFNFIRRQIFANQAKGFTEGAESLQEAHNSLDKKEVPEQWETPKNDLALLMAISDKGIGYLRQIKYSGDEYGLSGIKMNKKKLLKRAEWICRVYHDFFSKQRKQGKYIEPTEPEMSQPVKLTQSESSKVFKASACTIKTDVNGNIVYPIEITGTLRILNLGTIDYQRKLFHTQTNIFPIGYKSIREHQSVVTMGQRAYYTCEILDDGTKPLFKVTCSDEPDDPIIRETASGAWLIFVQRIANMQDSTRKCKPSVSGPDRFGLSEPAVLRLLQNMPNADQLPNYRRKTFS